MMYAFRIAFCGFCMVVVSDDELRAMMRPKSNVNPIHTVREIEKFFCR